jgi:hypothetical protein
MLQFLSGKLAEPIRRRLKGLAVTVRPRPHDIQGQIAFRLIFCLLDIVICACRLRDVTSLAGLSRRLLRLCIPVEIIGILFAYIRTTKDTRVVPGNSFHNTSVDINNGGQKGIDLTVVVIKILTQIRKLGLTRDTSRNVFVGKGGTARQCITRQFRVGFWRKNIK